MAESKQKKRALNIAMAIVAAVIIVSAVLAVWGFRAGTLPGSATGDSAQTSFSLSAQSGVVDVERSGVGFHLDDDASLLGGDKVSTSLSSSAEISGEPGALSMDEETSLTCENAQEGTGFSVSEGQLAWCPESGKGGTVAFSSDLLSVAPADAVLVFSVHSGASTINVLSGSVQVSCAGKDYKVAKGQVLSAAAKADGSVSADVSKLSANSLNDWAIKKLLDFQDGGMKLSLKKKALKKALAARSSSGTSSKSAGEPIASTANTASEASGEAASEGQSGGDSSAASSTSGESSKGSSKGESGTSSAKTCTIEIRCDTILDNMSDLEAGKDRFVPKNGTILAASTVEFEDGDTVFDVLKAVCDKTGIQLEYSFTPLYNSYYIEGLNNLYEFDCGNESGWIYKVNGWSPNYGCSVYTLKDGDKIVWCYTCKGYGADVGGSVR